MHYLGHTRSAHRSDHLLQTPDTFVRARLPGMKNATAIIHAAPARGARFTQYTAEFESGGELGPAAVQRFVYVIAGRFEAGPFTLGPDHYAYFPSNAAAALAARTDGIAVVIEKPYRPISGIPRPHSFSGSELSVAPQALSGDPSIEVRSLVPDQVQFDFAVNTMTYQPGATLPMVEIHVMEHGLLMLAGGGIYRLGDGWYPVETGDFIWMAPHCPQWFGALGKTPAKYLIYKDWNRHPLTHEPED